jgi:RNA polymerase sigma-70 factor (ECF subfamily)
MTMAPAFLAARERSEPFAAMPEGALEERLQAMLAEGRAAWPDVSVEADVFAQHVARVLDVDAVPATLEELRASDLFLACACAAHHVRALELLERRYLDNLPARLTRFGDRRGFVADVMQELRERLLVGEGSRGPRIAAYSGNGRIEVWLRVTAVRLAVDQQRKGWRDDSGDEPAEDALLGSPDPELDFIKAQYRSDFAQAFREAVGSLPPDERALLRLYLLEGKTVDVLGKLLGVSRATAARRVVGCRRKLLDETRSRLRVRLGISDSEADSLIRLLRTHLGSGLRQLFSAD